MPGTDKPPLEVPHFPPNEELEMLLKPIEATNTPESQLLCFVARQGSRALAELHFQSPILLETNRQAARTNGRVTAIESANEKKWLIFKTTIYVTGGLIILVSLIAPAFPDSVSLVLRRILEMAAG